MARQNSEAAFVTEEVPELCIISSVLPLAQMIDDAHRASPQTTPEAAI